MRNTYYTINYLNYDIERNGDIILAIRRDSKKIISLNESCYNILMLFKQKRIVNDAFEKWNAIPFEEKPQEDVFKNEFMEVLKTLIKEELLCEETV